MNKSNCNSIFVIGGTGFVGSEVIKILKKKIFPITLLDQKIVIY